MIHGLPLTITSSSSGIDCGPDCCEEFMPDLVVTLMATPDVGSRFLRWSGCDSVSGASCVVTMSSARSVAAQFLRARR
jgi:hypothetical protein